jgi:hypothetical protein
MEKPGMSLTENHFVIPENHHLIEMSGKDNVRDVFIFPTELLNSTDVITITGFNPKEDLISLESDQPLPYWLNSIAGDAPGDASMLEIKYPGSAQGVLVIFEGVAEQDMLDLTVKQHTSLTAPTIGYAPLDQVLLENDYYVPKHPLAEEDHYQPVI